MQNWQDQANLMKAEGIAISGSSGVEVSSASNVSNAASNVNVAFANYSLEDIVSQYLEPHSVKVLFDLKDLWYTNDFDKDGQEDDINSTSASLEGFTFKSGGNDVLRAILLECLSPDAILYTSLAPMTNSWMQLMSYEGRITSSHYFIRTGFRFEGSCVYKIAIRKAIEEGQMFLENASNIMKI
jgi:hypothetical protein